MNIFKSALTDQEVDFFGPALIFKQPSFTNYVKQKRFKY